jgi:cobalt-zinc-cadmium efflux system outer membrane protein
MVAVLMAWPCAWAVEKPFAPVEEAVKKRTGRMVRWEEDATAREQSLAAVRTLLKRPLTATSAAQIALLNNRELQATFEEAGLSFADLREARRAANPEVEFDAKFPNRSPSGTKLEWGIAQSFLNLAMIPLRSRVAPAA